MFPTEHVKSAWIYHWTLWYVITHMLHDNLLPGRHINTVQSWCCRLALTSRPRWPSGVNLNGDSVNFTPDDRTCDCPNERWPVQLHRAYTLTSTASVHVCAELAAAPVVQNQTTLSFTVLPKKHFHLLKHTGNLSHVMFLLGLVFWGLLSTSANRWHQLLKHSVKQIAYPFLLFWNTSLPKKGLLVTCKQRTWPGWHTFVLSTLTVETMPQNNYNARCPGWKPFMYYFTQTSGNFKVRLCTGQSTFSMTMVQFVSCTHILKLAFHLVPASSVEVAMQHWDANEIPGWQGDLCGHTPADLQYGPFRATPKMAPICSADVPLIRQLPSAEAGAGPWVASEWSRRNSSILVYTSSGKYLETHPFKLKPLPEIDLYLCHRLQWETLGRTK